MKSSTKKSARLAVLFGGALLLAGCNSFSLGVAATVGEAEITVSEVDATTQLHCELGNQAASRGFLRQTALSNLIEFETTRQYAEERGLEPDPGVVAELKQGWLADLESVPEDLREDYLDYADESVRGLATLIASGSEITGTKVELEELQTQYQGLVNAGGQDYTQWLAGLEIETHSPFAPLREGEGAGNSYSQPVSEIASIGDPSQGSLEGLPSSQVCTPEGAEPQQGADQAVPPQPAEPGEAGQ